MECDHVDTMMCFWCHGDFDSLTDDHIVPYSLGGTTEYTVRACHRCQNRLSKAEHETARKSALAIHALASPLAARHPDRPTSGHLQPTYLLVKHPEGGYGETLLSAGERASLLSYFEIRIAEGEPLEGRVRGTTEGARRLLDIFRSALKSTPSADRPLMEIKTSCELAPEIADDRGFWPRIVLLPGDRLLLRGRKPEELIHFIHVFTQLATSNYAVPDQWSTDGGEIKRGTPHLMRLQFAPRSVRRVATKIAYALFISVAKGSIDPDQDALLRNYVLGFSNSPDEPVVEGQSPLTTTTSSSPHYFLLSPSHDPRCAVVSLYGFTFRIELGSLANLSVPVAMICEIDGSGMRIASPEELSQLAVQVSTLTFAKA